MNKVDSFDKVTTTLVKPIEEGRIFGIVKHIIILLLVSGVIGLFVGLSLAYCPNHCAFYDDGKGWFMREFSYFSEETAIQGAFGTFGGLMVAGILASVVANRKMLFFPSAIENDFFTDPSKLNEREKVLNEAEDINIGISLTLFILGILVIIAIQFWTYDTLNRPNEVHIQNPIVIEKLQKVATFFHLTSWHEALPTSFWGMEGYYENWLRFNINRGDLMFQFIGDRFCNFELWLFNVFCLPMGAFFLEVYAAIAYYCLFSKEYFEDKKSEFKKQKLDFKDCVQELKQLAQTSQKDLYNRVQELINENILTKDIFRFLFDEKKKELIEDLQLIYKTLTVYEQSRIWQKQSMPEVKKCLAHKIPSDLFSLIGQY